MRYSRAEKLLGLFAVILAVNVFALAAPASAKTYTVTSVKGKASAPTMYFNKTSNPLNSRLVSYLSMNGRIYSITMRAGSGNGSKDTCKTNAGWLPNGKYSNKDSDSRSFVKFYHKTDGNAVIRGDVWYIGDHKCHTGKYRTQLFIHSEGTSGWKASNYKSDGCIKIDQDDRAYLAKMYKKAFDTKHAELIVR
jgi:hypothetical protein